MEDVNKCIEALQNGDRATIDRTAGTVRSRVARVDNVVSAEMGSYEQGPYTETVQRALHMMRESSKYHILIQHYFLLSIPCEKLTLSHLEGWILMKCYQDQNSISIGNKTFWQIETP